MTKKQTNKFGMEAAVEEQIRMERAKAHAQLDQMLKEGSVILVRQPMVAEAEVIRANYQAALSEQARMTNYYRHHANEAQQRIHELGKEIDRLDHANRPTSAYDAAGRDVGKLVEHKNAEYGNSAAVTSKMLEVLYPNGIPVEAYANALLIVRVLDKLCRISRGNQGDENAWRDVAGYGILGMVHAPAVVRPAVQGQVNMEQRQVDATQSRLYEAVMQKQAHMCDDPLCDGYGDHAIHGSCE